MRRVTIGVLSAALLVAACEESSDSPKTRTQQAKAAPEPAPPPAVEPEPELAVDDVPTREDFEAEANEEITDENFRDELAQLESELESE